MIEFKNIKLSIKNLDILTDVSFSIPDNSVTCFVGVKNSGKSAILKLIASVFTNYYGEIKVDDKYLDDSKKKIAMIFDKREKNTNLTVNEYLLSYGLLANKNKKELIDYIDTSLKKFSIMSYKHTDVDSLDEHIYKFLQIIRAYISDPDIILVDNIFYDNDQDYIDKMREFFKTQKGKKTIIFASRTLSKLEDLCDNIGVVENGMLISYGDKNKVYSEANISKKIEVKLFDGEKEAVDLLKSINEVSDISYEDGKIVFSFSGDEIDENQVLTKLINFGIKVYSFKKENVTSEQLLGKLKDNTYAKY